MVAFWGICSLFPKVGWGHNIGWSFKLKYIERSLSKSHKNPKGRKAITHAVSSSGSVDWNQDLGVGLVIIMEL